MEQVLKSNKEGNMMHKVILQNTDKQYSYIGSYIFSLLQFPARAKYKEKIPVCLEFFSIAAKERRYNILQDLHVTTLEGMRSLFMYAKIITCANFSYQLKGFKFTQKLN